MMLSFKPHAPVCSQWAKSVAMEHIKQLLTTVLGNFKAFINTVPTMATILKNYPVLSIPFWIIFQAGLVLEEPSLDGYMDENIKLLMKSIENLMHAGAKGIICSEGEEGDEEPSEAKLFEIIAYMEMQINATKNSSIFIMRQPGDTQSSATILNTPCFITTKSVALGIDQAFLYVDSVLLCEIAKPTVIELLKIWIAAHYVFNIQYGKETINVALLLEDAVLKDKGLNSMHHMQREKGPKSRKVARSNKLQTFYGRLKEAGLNFDI